MEILGIIETMRNMNGFSEGNYGKYKNRLRVEMRKSDSKEKRNIYKLEANMSKFLILNSTGFLKNSLRMLRKDRSEFSTMYSGLIMAIMGHAIGKPVEIDVLLQLRERYLPFKSFLDQVDSLLESSSYNFDVSSLKVKDTWYNVEIRFNTISEREMFLNEQVAPQGNGYDAILVKHILLIEKRKKQLFSLVNSKPDRIVCVTNKIGKLLEALERMNVFLQENLVESIYIAGLIKETRELEEYYLKVKDFAQFVKWDESIDSFVVPRTYEDLATKILKTRETVSPLSRKYMKKAVFTYLEKVFRPREPTINVPFIPVIFDVAADYINYPVEDRKMSELLKNIQVSK